MPEYRYKGDPDWTPGDTRYRKPAKPAGETSTTRKAARMTVFAARLDRIAPGWRVPRSPIAPALLLDAAAAAGIGGKTAGEYVRELRRKATK